MDKILIIGAGWEQLPLVEEAKKMGLYTIVTTWWNQEKISADKIYNIDSRDISELEKVYCIEKPNYVIADECDYSMYAVAYLTDKYGCPGPSLLTQTITNNKFLQRECVRKIGVKQPQYSLCWNLDSAKKMAFTIGYPIMVKPIDNRGSIGVSKVENEDDLTKAWYLAVANAHSRMCIVEKYIEGNIVTAEGFYDSEGFEFIVASTKKMYDENPNLAKIVYYPAKIEDELIRKIKWSAEQVANEVQINFGFSHMEFIVEKNTEEIYFVEAANRGGGVYTSNKVLTEITGIDYNRALLEMAMGRQITVKCHQKYKKKAIIYFMKFSGNQYFNCDQLNTIKECIVLFVKQYISDADVLLEAAVGRQGIGVFSGTDLDKLETIGQYVEQLMAQDDKEHYFVRRN